MSLNLQQWLCLFFMIVFIAQDLTRAKVKNQISFLFLAILLGLRLSFTPDLAGAFNVALEIGRSTFTGLLITYALWRLRVIGGGDAKIFLALSTLFTWNQTIELVFYSLVWGGLLGLFTLALQMFEIKWFRFFSFASYLTIRESVSRGHRIPLTVGILFGLLTLWTAIRNGISWL